MKRVQVNKSKSPSQKKARSQNHNSKMNTSRLLAADESQYLELQKALHLLSDSKSKMEKEEKQFALSTLRQASISEGLTPDAIITVMNSFPTNSLDLGSKLQLVSFLVPQSTVPEEAVMTLTYYLTLQSFSVNLKVKLLKWALTYYNVIESYENFLALYDVLFILLESDIMRQDLCKLLCAMTTRQHTTRYRIRFLEDLQMRVGAQPALLALLNAFNNVKLEYHIGSHDSKRVNAILRAVPKHKRNLEKLQHKNLDNFEAGPEDSLLLFTMDIVKYEDFIECVQSLEGVQGIEVLIQSEIRRMLLTLPKNDDLILRLGFYLQCALYEEKNSHRVLMMQRPPKAIKREITEIKILPTIAKLNFELQGGVPETTNFLCRLLKVWDGNTLSDVVFRLIPYWELCSFASVMEDLLQPLFKHFCVGSVMFQCRVIQCLTEMYKNWMLFEVPHYTKGTRQLISCREKSADFNPYKEIKELADCMDKLCVLALAINPTHPPFLLNQVLQSYQVMLLVHRYIEQGTVPLPSLSVICAAVFSPNTIVLEQLCTLMLSYNQEIGRMKEESVAVSIDINQLNIYMTYMFEALWKGIYSPAEIFTSDPPSTLRGEKDLFRLYNNPDFRLIFKKDHPRIDLGEALNRGTLEDSFFFVCLASNGFPDISEFMYTCIKKLDGGDGEDHSETD